MGGAANSGAMMSGAGSAMPGMAGGTSGAMPGMSGGYPGGSPAAGGGPGGYGQLGGGQAIAKTPRPESYDAWTDEDFVTAVQERDEKVLDAIDSKAKSAPGDSKVAVLLTSLLDVVPLATEVNPNGAAGGVPSSGAGGYPGGYPGSADRKSVV